MAGGLFTWQPFKALYSTYALLKLITSLPIWLIYFSLQRTRPNANWTLAQTVRVKLIKHVIYSMSVVRGETSLLMRPRWGEKDRFVAMSPMPDKYIQGPLKDTTIKPGKVGGLWYPERYPASSSGATDVVLHFHGGAFVIGDGRSDTPYYASSILKTTAAKHVFCVAYRLSSSTNGRFPAALQDAVTAYSYLVHDLSIAPGSIIVTGDSAGGNLALSLLRWLAEYGEKAGLASPGCAYLWSPWVDLATAANPLSLEQSPNKNSDYITSAFGGWGARTYCPHREDDKGEAARQGFKLQRDDAWISPLHHPFKTSTPLFIQVGECEVLYADGMQLAGQLEQEGNVVETDVVAGAVHDIALIGNVVKFDKEAQATMKKAGRFRDAHRK